MAMIDRLAVIARVFGMAALLGTLCCISACGSNDVGPEQPYSPGPSPAAPRSS